MNREEYDALWLCALCGARKVVPDLARDCEQRHLDEVDAPKVVDSVPRMSDMKAPSSTRG